jgi:hypothetical protein
VAGACDAGGGVGGGLQQRMQLARGGKGAAGAVEQFEHVRFVAQRLLGALDFVDVGVGAEPAQYLAVAVAHRVDPGQEPAVLAVRAADRIFHLERVAAAHGRLPALHHQRQHTRIAGRLPAPADHLVGRGAGVVEPAFVEPDDGAVGLGHPGQLRNRVGQGAQHFLALAQGVLGALAGADVLDHAGHAQHAFAAARRGIVGAPDQGHPAGFPAVAAVAQQAAFEFDFALAGKGLQHRAPHGFAVVRVEAGAQLGPGQRGLGGQARRWRRRARPGSGGRWRLPSASRPGRRRPAPPAGGCCPAGGPAGRPCGGRCPGSTGSGLPARAGRALRTSGAAPDRRIPGSPVRGAPSHRGKGFRARCRAVRERRPTGRGRPGRRGCAAAAPACPARAVDIADAPVVVDGAEAVGQAFEHVFHTLVSTAQRLPGLAQLVAHRVSCAARGARRKGADGRIGAVARWVLPVKTVRIMFRGCGRTRGAAAREAQTFPPCVHGKPYMNSSPAKAV